MEMGALGKDGDLHSRLIISLVMEIRFEGSEPGLDKLNI